MFPFTLEGSLRRAEHRRKHFAQTIVDNPQRIFDKPQILGLMFTAPPPSAEPQAEHKCAGLAA
jgi:hypothetical protein